MFNLSENEARLLYRRQLNLYYMSIFTTVLSATVTLGGFIYDIAPVVLMLGGGLTGFLLCLTFRTETLLNNIRRTFPDMTAEEDGGGE